MPRNSQTFPIAVVQQLFVLPIRKERIDAFKVTRDKNPGPYAMLIAETERHLRRAYYYLDNFDNFLKAPQLLIS